ncbi:hypothetical protein LSTR_LSTR009556 [Laodelphax striatellus]|uniref:DNA polymerase n=1 Tax=Laodelphax striatellus TaxID=195883 RepID=A0A482WTW2_LAOST|nr:hypothetical protein LSTR_LSTR009556 [Laodelphax striatellus]
MSKRKAPSNEDNLNQDLCEFLIELSNYERNVNRNTFKYNAYRTAASTLASHSTRVTSGKEAQKLDGVGDKIAKKIDEFLSTGTLKKLENIRNDSITDSINLLTRVSGIGPAKAKQLFDSGIRTLDDLHKNQDKLNHHQLIGLKYFDDFEKKIPREEIQEIETIIKESVTQLDPAYLITICGSYRRGKNESGDIDVLVTHPTYVSKGLSTKNSAFLLKQIVHLLEEKKLITDTLSLGAVKFMGVCKFKDDARRLDIRITPFDQYYCAILYFTGSDLFNKKMRAHALQKNFTLNEYTLRFIGCTGVPGNPVKIESEKDIFDCIDFPFKSPSERSV